MIQRHWPSSRLTLVLVAMLGIFTSLWQLQSATLLADEVVYLDAGQAYLTGDFTLNQEHPFLAKLLFGVGGRLTGDVILGGRLLSALASLATGALLWQLLRRLQDPPTGQVAAALWFVLPHAARPSNPIGAYGRLDRFAMLDPVATVFAVAALVTAEVSTRRRAWHWPLATGALVGLAASAKVIGGWSGVAVLLFWVITDREDPRTLGRNLGLLTLGTAGAIVSVHAVAGGEAVDALRFMVEFQAQHVIDGHAVEVAGDVVTHAPWWSHLWYHLADDGVLATAVFGGLGAWGIARSKREARVLLTLAVAVPALVLMSSPVALFFYRFLWMPGLTALVAIGVVDAARRALDGSSSVARRALPSVALAAVTALAALTIVAVAQTRPTGYGRLADHLGPLAPDTTMFVVGQAAVAQAHLPSVTATTDLDADLLIVDREFLRRHPNPDVDVALATRAATCEDVDGLTVCRRDGVGT